MLAQAHRLRAEFCVAVEGVVEIRPEGNANPEIATGDIEVNATTLTVLGECAPLPFQLDEPAGEESRLKYRYIDLRRDGPAAAIRLRSKVNAAARGVLAGHDFVEVETPDDDPLHARGCARLPGAGAAAAGVVLRAAAEPAAVQAVADGGRDGAVLPDRPLLPRRGFPRRPPARVHPARHGDEFHRCRGHHRDLRGGSDRAVGADRLPDSPADPADHLRRRHAAVRFRQARLAVRARARRVHRVLQGHHVSRFPGALCRRGRDARRRVAAAAHPGRLAGVGQTARTPRAGVRAGCRGRHAGWSGGQEPDRRRTRRSGSVMSAPSPGIASSFPPARRSPRAPCWAPPAARSPAGST